jgi:hypothetical protein
MFMQSAAHFAPAHATPAPVRVGRPSLPTGPGGLAAGARVETEHGWRCVTTLRPGLRLHTWDGGLQPLVRLDRIVLPADEGLALVRIPGGTLGACAALLLAPGQRVLLATGRRGPPETARALVPALALRGHGGTTARPARGDTVLWRPVFATEEVIWANTGVALHCAGADGAEGHFATLDARGARALLARLPARQAA